MNKIEIESLRETQELAFQVANFVKNNNHTEYYILLKGDLGAGKTTFTKFLLKNLGVIQNVTSPTFVIMNQYQTIDFNINHIDAYRLNDNQELDMFMDEFCDSLNIIEWYENLNINFEKLNYLKINISLLIAEKRLFEIKEKNNEFIYRHN